MMGEVDLNGLVLHDCGISSKIELSVLSPGEKLCLFEPLVFITDHLGLFRGRSYYRCLVLKPVEFACLL